MSWDRGKQTVDMMPWVISDVDNIFGPMGIGSVSGSEGLTVTLKHCGYYEA